jgi:hypothetical protein
VYKPLAGGGRCRRLSAADLEPDRLRLLAGAPALFQEEVPGANIRVYVVGDRVAAAYEIVSEELDYRGAEDAVVPTALDAAEHDACLRAAAACDMTFTGIDLRRRPDGGFAVLECNPSPMFAGIERWTGAAPVSLALTDLLLAGLGIDPGVNVRPGWHLIELPLNDTLPRGVDDGRSSPPDPDRGPRRTP